MSKIDEPDSAFPRAIGPWTDRIAFAKESPYAYRPNEIVIVGEADVAALAPRLWPTRGDDQQPQRIAGDAFLVPLPTRTDVEKIVSELQAAGVKAEPNYIFFAHTSGCGCGCALCGCVPSGIGGHPFAANPFAANPFAANPFAANPFAANSVTANPFAANPFAANPFAANPFAANPFAANGFAASGVRRTSAEPASGPNRAASSFKLPRQNAVNAIIYDTGVSITDHLPAELMARPQHAGAKEFDQDAPDESNDDLLDPVAGHGSFIAGIIEQLAPRQNVRVHSVLSTFGDGSAATIAARIDADVAAMDEATAQKTVMNMSFGSYADQQMYLLADAVANAQAKGCVVVASAGNDGTYLPTFPATLPGVISVASVDECGRAPYSNYGAWVRACAPGSQVVSSFFKAINGKQEPVPEATREDPEGFNGWASWSGTSFAAPIVASAILRQMAQHDQTAAEAAEVLIDGPGLLRLPGLGTVVNLAPGM